jgi:CheY-like chemotaxis protein
VLSVSDTGSGMSEATAAKAIEPFFSTKGVGRGTGLGLSMVHGLALQLGGELLIKSQLGLGTTIELYLPRALPTHLREVLVASATSVSTGAGRVLLVDDELAVRSTTADMLRELGYEVEEAGDAAAALRMLDEYLPDFVVTDHLMPGITGTELAGLVRERFPNVPTLIVSGYADIEGLSPHLPRLTKPFRRHELAASISALRSENAHLEEGGSMN